MILVRTNHPYLRVGHHKFHSRNKDVLQTIRRFKASMMKPSSIQSKSIYGTHDLELGRGSYDILTMLQAAKPEVPIWESGGSDFHESNPNLSRDFHRIWLGFSDSWKGLCPAAYIYVGHD
jgi:hypothetical protein